MNNIFVSLFNMSITASYLIIFVLIIRILFKSMPKSNRVYLWLIVGFRLICPFSFESILSLIPTTKVIQTNINNSSIIVDTTISEIDNTINPMIVNTIQPIIKQNYSMNIQTMMNLIWLIGFMLFVIYVIYSTLKLKFKLNEAILIKENIYVCDHLHSCFVFGIIHPKIYLPSTIQEYDKKYIIAHEKAHIQRKDHLLKPMSFLLLSIYWFNPIIWIAYKYFCKDLELACDEKVLNDLGYEIKKDYSNILINYSNPNKLGICPLAFGEENVKDRVISIMTYKKPSFWIGIIGSGCCLFMIVCLLTNPKAIDSKLIKADENDSKIGSMANIDDIEGWDIPIEDIESVEICGRLKDEKSDLHPISQEDGIKLVKAYNAIQNKDIYSDLTMQIGEYGISFYFNVITNDGKKHSLDLYQFNCVSSKELIYYTNFQLEYYDVIRDIYNKYGFVYIDYEETILDLEKYSDTDMILTRKNNFLALTDRNVNETLINYGFEEIEGYDLTFNEILKPYKSKIELNDVIETEEMYIKVIEIKDYRVSALAVTLK